MHYICSNYDINYGGSKMIEKLIKTFFNIEFLKFILIGIINSFNGIWIAYCYSLIIENAIIAYVFGFFSSLCISYVLNSIFNFKTKINLKRAVKFVINNIPNFIIQIFSVVVLLDILNIPKIYSYAVSAVIAVPITFVLVKTNVFKKTEVKNDNKIQTNL